MKLKIASAMGSFRHRSKFPQSSRNDDPYRPSLRSISGEVAKIKVTPAMMKQSMKLKIASTMRSFRHRSKFPQSSRNDDPYRPSLRSISGEVAKIKVTPAMMKQSMKLKIASATITYNKKRGSFMSPRKDDSIIVAQQVKI